MRLQKRGLIIASFLCLLLAIFILPGVSAIQYDNITAGQEVGIKHEAKGMWLSVNGDQDTGAVFLGNGLNLNRPDSPEWTLADEGSTWERFTIRKLDLSGNPTDNTEVLRHGDRIDFVSVKTDNVIKYISPIGDKDWLHAGAYSEVSGSTAYKVQIFKEGAVTGDEIKCSDKVYFKEIGVARYLDADFIGTQANSTHRSAIGSGRNIFQLYERDGKCKDITEGVQCDTLWWFDSLSSGCSEREFCGSYQYTGLETFSTEAECQTVFAERPPPVTPADISGTRHAAVDIRVDVRGVKYSLQSFINKDESLWRPDDHVAWHNARDVKVSVEGEAVTLQSYLENRLVKWDKVQHYSWEDGSKISISIGGVDTTVQDAIDEGVLAPETQEEEEEEEEEKWYYRCTFYDSKNKIMDHMTTIDVKECEDAGYVKDSIEFKFFREEDKPASGVVPIYRYYSDSRVDHLVSLSADYPTTYNEQQYTKDGTKPLGYIYSSPQPGTVPIYKCYSSGQGDEKKKDHMLTPDADCESDSYDQDGIGDGAEKIIGYAETRMGEEGRWGKVVVDGEIITLWSVYEKRFVSINSDGTSMEQGLNINRDTIGSPEKFSFAIQDGKEIMDGDKLSIKSERAGEGRELRYLTARRCTNAQYAIPALNVYCLTLLALYPEWEWLHANPDEGGRLFSEEIVKISKSAGDDKIRYGDTISFDCRGDACFRDISIYRHNPIARKHATIDFGFSRKLPSTQFKVCGENGEYCIETTADTSKETTTPFPECEAVIRENFESPTRGEIWQACSGTELACVELAIDKKPEWNVYDISRACSDTDFECVSATVVNHPEWSENQIARHCGDIEQDTELAGINRGARLCVILTLGAEGSDGTYGLEESKERCKDVTTARQAWDLALTSVP